MKYLVRWTLQCETLIDAKDETVAGNHMAEQIGWIELDGGTQSAEVSIDHVELVDRGDK